MIEADFDGIALLPSDGFDHNAYYHDFLLKCVGPHVGEALEIGCGKGQFSRLLAARSDQLLGLDLSSNMIAVAARECADVSNLQFERADVMAWNWPVERFDCIVSIATIHHLPIAEMLERMKAALRPGGVLAVLDLCATPIWLDMTALPCSLVLRLLHTGRLRVNPEARRLWAEHCKTDRYLSAAQVRQVCGRVLPGARVRQHLLWRYSLVWRKDC